jgi:hypothetical protein
MNMSRNPRKGAVRWCFVGALITVGVIGCGGGGHGGGGGFAVSGALDPQNPLVGSQNPIDQAALATLTSQLTTSARLSDDVEFIRRVTSDVAGRLPTTDEVQAFLADTSQDRRAKLIDRLLLSPDYFNHWAKDVLGPWIGVTQDRDIFDQAIALDLAQDVGIQQIVDSFVSGQVPSFDKSFDQVYMKVDTLMLAFTGMTSQCARCHDHKLVTPADDPQWLQDDNYGLYAFFAENPDDATKVDLSGTMFGKPVQPAFVIDGYENAPPSLPALDDPIQVRRAAFSQLFRNSNAFMRGTSHRIWSEISAPLLDPNQFLAANLQGMNAPSVLDALTQTFRDQGSSLRGFLRQCLNSRLYQLSSDCAIVNSGLDGIARHKVRRQHAEVIESAYAYLGGVDPQQNDFLRLNFGYPTTRTIITERSDDVNSAQAAILMNSDSVAGVISQGPYLDTLASSVDGGTMTLTDAVTAIFNRALSRNPNADELQMVVLEAQQCQQMRSTRDALEDVSGALAATIEFVAH